MAAHVPPLSKTAVRVLTVSYLLVSALFVFAAATDSLPKGWLTLGWIEAVGIVTSILFAWLEVRESPWNWPVAIVASLAYALYFKESGLLANAWLQVYYVVVSALGWYWWLRGGEQKTVLSITRATGKTWLVLGGLVALAVPTVTWLMTLFKQSPKFLDVLTAVLSIAGEALLARKIFETWWIWTTVNAIYVVMLWQSPFSAGLYAFFFVLSLLGWIEWRRALVESEPLPQS